MYNHNKAQQSKNRVHISWDILYVSQTSDNWGALFACFHHHFNLVWHIIISDYASCNIFHTLTGDEWSGVCCLRVSDMNGQVACLLPCMYHLPSVFCFNLDVKSYTTGDLCIWHSWDYIYIYMHFKIVYTFHTDFDTFSWKTPTKEVYFIIF